VEKQRREGSPEIKPDAGGTEYEGAKKRRGTRGKGGTGGKASKPGVALDQDPE